MGWQAESGTDLRAPAPQGDGLKPVPPLTD
jgi:hypothetical protein